MSIYTIHDSLKKEFAPEQFDKIVAAIQVVDTDKDGSINEKELKNLLEKLGQKHDDILVRRIMNEVDERKCGVITFPEFCTIYLHIESGHQTGFGIAVKKNAEITKFQGKVGQHSYNKEDTKAFTKFINHILANDPDLPYIPMDSNSEQLFENIKDGILLAKLFNIIDPEQIDMRAVNMPTPKKPLQIFHKIENFNIVKSTGLSLGLKFATIHFEDIMEGKPYLVHAVLWQAIQLQLMKSINLKEHPELIKILNKGEELSDLMKLPPDQVLFRWFNYHLGNSECKRTVTNSTTNVSDSECYVYLLNQIDPSKCPLSILREEDGAQRAQLVIQAATDMGVETFIEPSNIHNGNKNLNLAFIAQIFNTCPGLTLTKEEETEVAKEVEKVGMIDFDESSETAKEEISFRMWMNSLGVEDVQINNLCEDISSGMNLIKIIDKIEPGIVDWKKVMKTPKLIFHHQQNANYVIDLGKQMGFSLVGIQGKNLIEKSRKPILAFMWQLMRYHLLSMLKKFGGGKPIAEADIVVWANQMVKRIGSERTISSFKDSSLSTSLYIFDVLKAINGQIINAELITPGETDKDKEMNAKYVISIARKIGCLIFLTWQDITTVKSKMMMTLFASLMYQAKIM